jgi:hypothetical protein
VAVRRPKPSTSFCRGRARAGSMPWGGRGTAARWAIGAGAWQVILREALPDQAGSQGVQPSPRTTSRRPRQHCSHQCGPFPKPDRACPPGQPKGPAGLQHSSVVVITNACAMASPLPFPRPAPKREALLPCASDARRRSKVSGRSGPVCETRSTRLRVCFVRGHVREPTW